MEKFEIVTKTAMSNAAVSIVGMVGVLDINTVGDFESTLEALFKSRKYKIVLNFEKLIYISSAGVGLLVGNIKDVRKKGGDIKIASVNPDVYKVLDLLEIPRIFQILKTEHEAIGEFGGSNPDKVSYV